MLKIISFSILLINSNCLAINFEKSTVKTASGFCQSDTNLLHGSGLIFKTDEHHFYVLTSDHVIVHSNEGYCHSIDYHEHKLQAQLKVADSSIGLAILSLKNVQEMLKIAAIPLLSELGQIQILPDKKVYLAGFPSQLNSLATSSTGHVSRQSAQITVSKSDRRILPNLDQTIEIGQADAERGMSGGPAWTYVNDSGINIPSFVGLLSNLVIHDVSEDASAVINWEESVQRKESKVALIPANVVIPWVQKMLNEKHTLNDFLHLEANSQIQSVNGYQSISTPNYIYKGLRIEFPIDYRDQEHSLMAMIPGGDGVGIGGPDRIHPSLPITLSLTGACELDDTFLCNRLYKEKEVKISYGKIISADKSVIRIGSEKKVEFLHYLIKNELSLIPLQSDQINEDPTVSLLKENILKLFKKLKSPDSIAVLNQLYNSVHDYSNCNSYIVPNKILNEWTFIQNIQAWKDLWLNDNESVSSIFRSLYELMKRQ